MLDGTEFAVDPPVVAQIGSLKGIMEQCLSTQCLDGDGNLQIIIHCIGNKDFSQFPCILAGERLKCEQFFLCHQDRHSLFQFHLSLSWEADTPL